MPISLVAELKLPAATTLPHAMRAILYGAVVPGAVVALRETSS